MEKIVPEYEFLNMNSETILLSSLCSNVFVYIPICICKYSKDKMIISKFLRPKKAYYLVHK